MLEVDYKEDFDGLYFSSRSNVFVGAMWRDWRAYRLQRRAQRARKANRDS